MTARAASPTRTRQVLPWRLDCHVAAGDDAAAADELRRALTAPRPTIPPRWFYDDAGCDLFVRITDLDEYYQTRAEQQILDAHMDSIVAAHSPTELVEIGSGAARKTRAILDAMERAGTLTRFVPFDVSPGVIAASATDIAAAYPGTRVHGIAGDFVRHLPRIPRRPADGRRLVAFLGGTLGNLEPAPRSPFVHVPDQGHIAGAAEMGHDPCKLPAARRAQEPEVQTNKGRPAGKRHGHRPARLDPRQCQAFDTLHGITEGLADEGRQHVVRREAETLFAQTREKLSGPEADEVEARFVKFQRRMDGLDEAV